MELEDTLADLLNGVRQWKARGIGGCDWTDNDEMLLRWIEAGPAKDEL
jgi:hypothetical protein